MCTWGTHTPVMILMPAELHHTGKAHFEIKMIDSCIAPLIRRLNAAGIFTSNCCCGHGKADASIHLQDGTRMLVPQPRTTLMIREPLNGLTTNGC